jgi:hypothetical protein
MDVKAITSDLAEFIFKQRDKAHGRLTKSKTIGFTFAPVGSEGFRILLDEINTLRPSRVAFVQELLFDKHRLKRSDLPQLVLSMKLTKEHYAAWEKIGPLALAIATIGVSYIIFGITGLQEKSLLSAIPPVIIAAFSALITWMAYQMGRTKSFLDEAILLVEACKR